MSRFNAKISLTGRTYKVNISTARDHIHLILLPVLLLLLHSLILILTHHTCLRLRMGKPGFLLKSHRRKRVSKPPTPLYSTPQPFLPLKMTAIALTSCNPFHTPWAEKRLSPTPLQPPLPVTVNLKMLRLIPISSCQ